MSNLSVIELEKEIYNLLNCISNVHEVIVDLPKQQSYTNIDIKLAVEHDKALSKVFEVADKVLTKHGMV
jgi:uncharacterized protein YqgV (UPF0045/DUF77 family)